MSAASVSFIMSHNVEVKDFFEDNNTDAKRLVRRIKLVQRQNEANKKD